MQNDQQTPQQDPTNLQSEPLAQDEATDVNAEVNLLKDQLMRALAEAENIRKRAEREKQDTSKYAVSGFAKEMLSVADNMERALLMSVDIGTDDPKIAAFVEGINLTAQTLHQIFDRHGIKKIDPKGQKFDHNFHQAMSEIPSDVEAGCVVEVYQPGYVIHDRLLRAAMVAVSKGK